MKTHNELAGTRLNEVRFKPMAFRIQRRRRGIWKQESGLKNRQLRLDHAIDPNIPDVQSYH
jgi:hypothetical protein